MKTGVVDVGGGLRGIYAAGVLDYCMEHDIRFDLGIGVSAGSANLASYAAGQIGRNYKFYTEYAFRRQYMGIGNFIFKHSFIDMDYVYGTLCRANGEYPLDYPALRDNPMELYVVATDARMGQAKYFGKEYIRQDDYDIFKASSSIPFICKPYEIQGVPYYDGALGDRVYGRMPLKKIGAFAEYAAVDQNAIAKVPAYLSDEEAASVPLTALTALQAFELMSVKPGKTVFISGGTGSLGAMAIPIAKSMGLNVITNGSAENKERVIRLGADRFIDYKSEDYSKVLSEVDYVLDTLGIRELEKEFSILKSGGSIVSLRGLPNGEFAVRTGMPTMKRFLFSIVGSKYDKMAAKNKQKYYFVFVREDGAGLKRISDIFGNRKIETSVDKIYDLSEVNQALAKVAGGGSKGKTIIKIS